MGRHGLFRRERAGFDAEGKGGPCFCVWRRFAEELAARSIGSGHAVKGVAVLPIVLEPPVVHVEHGDAKAGSGFGQHAVAFVIFPKGEGRGGEV